MFVLVRFIRISFILQVAWLVVTPENICQQCNRGVQNCRKISGIFTVTQLGKGYNPVIEIPAGTCNINVTEYQPSKNFLDNPGRFNGAGTVFMYSRESEECHGECVYAEGPTNDIVIVQVIYSENNPGILYEFTLPPNVEYTSPLQIVPNERKPHKRRHHRQHNRGHHGRSRRNHGNRQTSHRNDDTRNYQSSPTYGSHTLGGRGLSYSSYIQNRQQTVQHVKRPRYVSPYGNSDIYRNRYGYQALRSGQTQSRSVINRRTNTNSIPLQIPDQQRSNSITVDERYSWKISGFTECSQTCGGGRQTTKIVCVLSSTQVVVTDNNCADQSKPLSQEIECNTSPCPPSWETGPWSACSVTCENGVQRRRIECKRRISESVSLSVSASHCSREVKPAIIQQCNGDPCSRWEIGEWGQCSVKCGTGVIRRSLNCVDSAGNIVLKTLCSQPEPISSDSCDMGSCDYHWFLSSWSTECSSSCGTSVITRQVHCASNTGKNISDSYCDQSRKPVSQKQCPTNQNCGNKWFAGPWSLCSSTCGSGIKTREVSCVGRDGSDRLRILPDQSCDMSDKPVERQVCQQTACGSQWYMTDWSQCSVSCGNGTQTRYVHCLTQSKDPSIECDLSSRPAISQPCDRGECHTNLPAKDPSCKNRYSNCRVVVQARLCHYKYYNKICCEACYNDKIHKIFTKS
ncbi:hypothetical protein KUTeg_017992 [Tegillarca granosa]|uniref:PLAC domain-containing protein n=1 Tax=Tegillarca granosa TaxID=220873 RepID=A0ABQ9EI19_TEGGR|nr:hypothetical protein KUTeg_017992 [Tegillarca granosa]